MPTSASSGQESPQPPGWVPQRTSAARLPVVRPRVVPAPLASATSPALPTPVALGASPVLPTPVALGSSPVVPAPLASATSPVAIARAALPPDSSKGRHRRPAPPKPAVLTLPVSLRGVRARPRRLAVLGVLVLLMAAAVVLGVRVAWARSSAQPQPIAATAHGPPDGLVTRTVPAAFASTGAATLPTAAGVLLAHVVGQVRRPGVVRLPPGARVLDAVRAAGGASSSADLNHLNLARPVADGEQIVVPKPGETIATAGVRGSGASGASTGAASGGQGAAGGGSGEGLVDLNSADASTLDSLPGVGPVLSQRILDWRAEHGRFSSVDELGEVTGIGDKLLAQIGPRVRV